MALSGVVIPGETLKSQETVPCDGCSMTLCFPRAWRCSDIPQGTQVPREASGGDLEAWNRSGSLCAHAPLAPLQVLGASNISWGVTVPALAGVGPL